MSISLFLKNVGRIERSGLVHLDTDQMELTEDTATISWECTKYRSFRIYYCCNDSVATLFLLEKNQDEKLMQAELLLSADPVPTVEKFIGLLITLLATESHKEDLSMASFI